ncbi:Hypothetical predicted protein [Mytilus galloprovincialis]|uniref:Uncharacterized protein n=1 Tax=Mytilus galloprovincialis TaxID=29158 RepID=A0A8B6GNX7_MYTGA|nr:Hypothetical predicted protein [Mytilus galloprovincialis]
MAQVNNVLQDNSSFAKELVATYHTLLHTDISSGLHLLSKNWLASPFNPDKVLQAKKIHLYTSTDIQKSYGLRRQKMKFINKKLRQLIEDSIVRSKNKTTIMGIAEVAWDVYNAEEASIDQIQVKSLITALNNMGHHYNEKQTKTI